MQLQHYFDVSQAPDLPSFERMLVQMAGALDFPLVTASLVVSDPTPRGSDRFYTIGNTPTAFLEASKDAASAVRDPVSQRMKALSVPFTYTQELYVSEGAADLWDEQAPFGYVTGIAVALHLPDHRHFLLGVDRDLPLPEAEHLARMMADLQLLAVHAQSAATRLLLPEENEVAAPKLTPREIEILRWTMDGKSAWAIGEILSISEHTVHFHLRNLCKKFESSSKHQAALKAVKLGLL